MTSNPTDLRYTATHEWCRFEGQTATIGITQHAVEQLMDLVYVNLPAVKATVSAGKPFGEIESVKAVSELNSPVSGEVVARNEAVLAEPATITADPYGQGWLIKVRISNPKELDALLDAAAYEATLTS